MKDQPECREFQNERWLLESGEMDPDRRIAWVRHLKECGRCSTDLEKTKELLDLYEAHLLEPDLEVIAESLRVRIPGRWRARGLRWMWVAATLLFAIVAGTIGYQLGQARPEQEAISSLEERIEDLEVRLALSDLELPSSATRLKAASMTAPLVDRDRRVMDALLDALATDPSPTVRMAALDNLYRAKQIDALERRFGELLRAQDSKLLLVAMIELAADREIEEARPDLERLAEESRDSQVREKALWAVEELSGEL